MDQMCPIPACAAGRAFFLYVRGHLSLFYEMPEEAEFLLMQGQI